MSLEAITKIRGVGEEMDEGRAQARAQAQKILTDAEQAGQELLERGRRTSADKTAGVMRAAEERGAQRRDEILAAAEEDCAALRRLAETNMTQAAQWIVERVVEG